MSLLGVDVGTTGCKASAFSADGRPLSSVYREYPTLHPAPDCSELDSFAVWEAVKAVIAGAAAGAAGAGDPVSALSCSSMGEAVAPVTRDRRIAGRSILSSDTRGGELLEPVRRAYTAEQFYRINANILGPNYTLPKLLWHRAHEPELFQRADKFLLWGDAVGYLLGGEAVACHSLASRTLLFDLRRGDWSDELLRVAGLSREKLGRCVAAGTVTGTVSAALARELGLPAGTAIVAGGHDQCCNALGAGVCRSGQAVCGIGSFECLTPAYDRIPEPAPMLARGLNTEHHVLPGLYVSFLYNQGGTLVKWFRDTFAAGERDAAGGSIYAKLDGELPAEPTRLLALPYFEMTGPPDFTADAAGAIIGLKTGTTRGEIFKCILESVTYYFVDSLAGLRELGADASSFTATGGGAKSDKWLQIKADIFGVPFIRPAITEAGVLGAAILAGLGTGVYATAAEGVGLFVRRERVFEPDAGRHAVYRERAALYRQLFPALHPLLRKL
jgi:xylulokinase